MNRRDFIAGCAAAGVAAGLPKVAPRPKKKPAIGDYYIWRDYKYLHPTTDGLVELDMPDTYFCKQVSGGLFAYMGPWIPQYRGCTLDHDSQSHKEV